jgi:hypothetical protein
MKTLFGVLAGALAVYEIAAFVNRQKGDTISECVWRGCNDRPIVPFLFGLAAGHLFWQEVPTRDLLSR